MNQILPWIIPVVIVVAVSFSFVGLIVASTQIIIKKLKKKDE